MGDVDEARRNLDRTLRRAVWWGVGGFLSGVLLAAVAPAVGIAVAVVGFIIIAGAGFARGYYLGN